MAVLLPKVLMRTWENARKGMMKQVKSRVMASRHGLVSIPAEASLDWWHRRRTGFREDGQNTVLVEG